MRHARGFSPLRAATRVLMSKKSTRVDFACQALRRAIIEQALRRAPKCRRTNSGIRFGMSRTLVRAAWRSCNPKAWSMRRRAARATTAKPTLAEAREVFEIRRMPSAKWFAS